MKETYFCGDVSVTLPRYLVEDPNSEENHYKDIKNALRKLIHQNCYRYSPEVPFKLNCGEMSPFYFNCKNVTLTQLGSRLIGEVFYNVVKDCDAVAIGGLTLGADPIAMATSLFALIQGTKMEPFIVRKQAKDHGVVKKIEGVVQPGSKVIVVDDVVTTGSSTIQAIEACLANGFNVVKAVVLVDRKEFNGMDNIRKLVDDVESIFSVDDFLNCNLESKNV